MWQGDWSMQTQHEPYPEPPDYEATTKDQWPQNAAEVPQLLDSNDPYLEKKVATYRERFGYPETEIKNKIISDPMFAALFAKDPSRTSIHENTASDWLSRLEMVEDFEKLPASGRDSFYVTGDGEIRKMQPERKPSKSLDFRWKTRGYTVYASHKYTKQSGGAQDNQFHDVRSLLENFHKKIADKKTCLLAIVDGKYYSQRKMSDLHRFCNTTPPLSWALPIGDVPGWLDKHCV